MGTSTHPEFSQARVLIVDKTPHGKKMLRAILDILGVQNIEMTGDTIAALALLRLHPFDLVFCSECAGPLSAAEFVATLRRDTQSRDMTVPVILLTAGLDGKQLELARHAGINDFIGKPVTIETIRRKLLMHLNRPAPSEPVIPYPVPDRHTAENRYNLLTDAAVAAD